LGVAVTGAGDADALSEVEGSEVEGAGADVAHATE
jgi:hypothetical protein